MMMKNKKEVASAAEERRFMILSPPLIRILCPFFSSMKQNDSPQKFFLWIQHKKR
jgi:hypothetical protein